MIGAFHPCWFGGRPPVTAVSDSYGTGRDGWLTEFKAVSQEAVLPLPASLSYEERATLPCAAASAWTALAGSMPVRAGYTVLTQGTGGVSIFALQLAKKLGARVIATTSSVAKFDRLRSLGADDVISYSDRPQWGDRVHELTNGRGVDRVVDVGGAGTVNQSLRAVTRGGEIVLIGFLGEGNPGIDYFDLKATHATIRSVGVGDRANLEDLGARGRRHGAEAGDRSRVRLQAGAEGVRASQAGPAHRKDSHSGFALKDGGKVWTAHARWWCECHPRRRKQ